MGRTRIDETELSRRLDALRSAVVGATATVTSPDHAVTVTAGPGGSVTSVEFSARALRLPAALLGPLVVETVREAAGQVDEALRAQAAELTGGRVDVTAPLRGDFAPPPPVEDVSDHEPPSAPTFSLGPNVPAFDDVEGLLDRFREEADRQRAAYAAARDDLATMTVSATSYDGAVAVTAGPGGIVAVDVDPSAMRHGAAGLTRLVTAAIQQATAQLAVAMGERVQQLTGPRLDVRALVREYLPAGHDEDGGR